MASQDGDSSSMFTQKLEKRLRSKPADTAVGDSLPETPTETITVKDFFDFMKTAYQVYEHLEGEEVEGTKIDWEELTKLTVINHVIDKHERDLLSETGNVEPKAISSKSDSNLCLTRSIEKQYGGDNRLVEKRSSCNDIDGENFVAATSTDKMVETLVFRDLFSFSGKRATICDGVEMLGVWTEANLNCKLNDVSKIGKKIKNQIHDADRTSYSCFNNRWRW